MIRAWHSISVVFTSGFRVFLHAAGDKRGQKPAIDTACGISEVNVICNIQTCCCSQAA